MPPHDALWLVTKKLGVPESLIQIVGPFHEGMESRVRVCEELFEETEVRNGLRVKNVEGSGMCLFYKLDQQLFMRSIRGAGIVGAA